MEYSLFIVLGIQPIDCIGNTAYLLYWEYSLFIVLGIQPIYCIGNTAYLLYWE